MDQDTEATIDPFVQARITSLASALGGWDVILSKDAEDVEQVGEYILGDDALGCLKDLKKWLKLHDENMQRYDVACSIAKVNLVEGDLLPILAIPVTEEERGRWRIALACIELIAPLTWPLELHVDNSQRRDYCQATYLKTMQKSYARAILYSQQPILRNMIQIAFPSMAIPRRDRSSRDEAIIRIILYTLRNLVRLEYKNNRTDVITSFHKNGVFELLEIIAASIDEFESHDIVLLEILFYTLKDIEVSILDEQSTQPISELGQLLDIEKNNAKTRAKQMAPRHNRFGTNISIVTSENKRYTISGQAALAINDDILTDRLDATKKWRRPKTGFRQLLKDTIGRNVFLKPEARNYIRQFLSSYIASAFNIHFLHMCRAFEREDQRCLHLHKAMFLYVLGKILQIFEVTQSMDDIGLVGIAFEPRILILLSKFMREAYDLKQWFEVQQDLDCLKSILLIIRKMSDSDMTEVQEISYSVQANLFYEGSTLELVIQSVRYYRNQGIDYLNTITDVAYILLKSLERYAKSNDHIFIRSRRRMKDNPEHSDDNSDTESTEQLGERFQERAFEFTKFERQFINENCIITYFKFLQNYRELSPDQIKRVIAFFHRVFVKNHQRAIMYRMDICLLFCYMAHDKINFPSSNPVYNETMTFIRYYVSKLVQSLHDSPSLHVEILFSKIPGNDQLYFLDHGYEQIKDHVKPDGTVLNSEAVETESSLEEDIAAQLQKENDKKLLKGSKRIKSKSSKSLTEEELEERRKQKEIAEFEKARLIKSSALVHDSDDETDEEADAEFFAKEALLREQNRTRALLPIKSANVDITASSNNNLIMSEVMEQEKGLDKENFVEQPYSPVKSADTLKRITKRKIISDDESD